MTLAKRKTRARKDRQTVSYIWSLLDKVTISKFWPLTPDSQEYMRVVLIDKPIAISPWMCLPRV